MLQNPIEGLAYVFEDNIDTDQIYPGRYLELTDPKEIASHCMEGVDPGFSAKFKPSGLIIGGKNFGCGSSREHAAIALKATGTGAVVAKSFARIFYRNAINIGLPVIVCPGIDFVATPGELLSIDTKSWMIYDKISGKSVPAEPVAGYAATILDAGGIKELMRCL